MRRIIIRALLHDRASSSPMTEAIPASPTAGDDRLADADQSDTRAVLARLNDGSFESVRIGLLRGLVWVLPWAIIAMLLFLLLIYNVREPMIITGLLAAATAAILFRALLEALPEVLIRLWTQRALKRRANDGKVTDIAAADYIKVVKNLDARLNNRMQWLCGIVVALAMYISFPIRLNPPNAWVTHSVDWMASAGGLYLLFVWMQVAFAFVLGLLLWRMIAIAEQISRLGRTFELNVQPQHPDHSGGLKVLGDICLLNASILIVPAIFLGGWLTAIPAFGAGNHYYVYVSYYQGLLIFVFTLATIAFIYPLLGVHAAMVRERSRLRLHLDGLSTKIDVLSRSILEETDVNRLQQLSNERTLRLAAYEQNSSIPVWPFDAAILRKFSLGQLIPLLSLTGISPTIVTTLQKVLQ